ncbi:MAG: hypothetical protein JSR55_10520 [Proteobacteria bacterium]|nr:hypothetical protein [Pseudomonadota bacterium]
MPAPSIRKSVVAAFRFSSENLIEILKRIVLPVICGGVVLYLLATAYIAELDRFLIGHDQRSASLVLALAGGGFLLLLFFHAVVITAVISLALGKPRTDGWQFFHVALSEWRVYAGLLRLIVICGILVVGAQGVRILLLRFGYDPIFTYLSQSTAFLSLIWILIRVGFFVGPVGVDRSSGQIVGRSWEISAGLFWRLLAISVLGLFPGLLFYLLGEYILRTTGMVQIVGTVDSLVALAGALHQMLLSLVVLSSATYVVFTIPLSAAAAFAYRDLTSR